MKKLLAALMFALMLLPACSSEEKSIGLNSEIQHDDYFYSIASFKKADAISGLKPKGVFYIVEFKVVNRAKRVDHPWKNSITYMVDEKGVEYDNQAEAQKTLFGLEPFNLKDEHVTKAGETETTLFVFDVPKDVKEPAVKFRGEFLMGDMFDGNNFKHTRVKLY